eukprot:TRINITY_DN40430_c0_g1_i2.p1 TRINITY_DN40430_c0_g1~~TRINITY_DN40430_c0_g1_i2.p1  ORF type:complete len:304 (+),score=93.63 TRINITY_DN40430_c0_g1_i2:36-947(+)
MVPIPPRTTLSSSSAASDVYKRQTCGKCFSEILTVEQHSFQEVINSQMVRPDWNTQREESEQKRMKLSRTTAIVFVIVILAHIGLWITICIKSSWRSAPHYGADDEDPDHFQYTCRVCYVNTIEMMNGWVLVLWLAGVPLHLAWRRHRRDVTADMMQERYEGSLGAVASAELQVKTARKTGDTHQILSAKQALQAAKQERASAATYTGPSANSASQNENNKAFIAGISKAVSDRISQNGGASGSGEDQGADWIDKERGEGHVMSMAGSDAFFEMDTAEHRDMEHWLRALQEQEAAEGEHMYTE